MRALKVSESFDQIFEAMPNGTDRKIRYFPTDLESGGTSMKFRNMAPGVRKLVDMGAIKPGMTVWENGAGKYSRNADPLRAMGVKVFTSDPYNGSPSVSGWEIGEVAKVWTPPSGVKFDVALTVFVINVVSKPTQDTIVSNMSQYADKVFHVSRNSDIYENFKKNLNKPGDNLVKKFFLDHWVDGEPDAEELKMALENGNVPDEAILAFAYFGSMTSKGFQRIPDLTRSDQGGHKGIGGTKGSWSLYQTK